jgi:hypothetical protein
MFHKMVEIGNQDFRKRKAENDAHGEVEIKFIDKNAFGVLYFDVLELGALFNLSFDSNIRIQDPQTASLSQADAQGNECQDLSAPIHSITLSVRTIIEPGILMPRVLAVFMFITNSKLVGNSTGISLGLIPLRILSTKWAVRRNISSRFTPYAIRPPATANSP